MNDLFQQIDVDVNHYDLFDSLRDSLNENRYDSDGFNQIIAEHNISNNKKDLSIIHVNIRSLARNGSYFMSYLETLKNNFEIIIYSETWLENDLCLGDLMSGYNCYNVFRPRINNAGGIGGGVTICITKELKSKKLVNFERCSNHIECVFVSIERGNSKLVIGGVYRPPHTTNYDGFQNEIISILTTLNNANNIATLLIGDFNIDLMKINTDINVKNFYDTLASLSFLPVITSPTRETNNTRTTIDNIFTNNFSYCKSGTLECNASDHYPIFIIFKNFFDRFHLIEQKTFRLINESTLQNFRNDLLETSFSEVINEDDVNISIEKFHAILLQKFLTHFPKITKNISRKDREKPWITGELKSLIKRREDYYRLKRRGLLSVETCNRFRNFVTKKLEIAKKEFYSKMLLDIKTEIKKTWNLINNIIYSGRDQRKTKLEKIVYNGETYRSDQGIANALNSHFSTVGRNISEALPGAGSAASGGSSTTVHGPTAVSDGLGGMGSLNSMFLSPVSPGYISSLISKQKNKYYGLDHYSAKVLKYVNDIISPVLSDIVNKSFSTACFPDMQKIARVVPLFKEGNAEEVNNWRPISNLPLLSKIIERAFYDQLYNYFEQKKLLNDSQFGFRRGKSTVQALMKNLDIVYRDLDLGRIVISIFLDFRKAFDVVDHPILLYKLEKYGIRGLPKQWISSYLSNRKQYVVINGVSSTEETITHGVPQGSILGPLLFNIFINDLPSCNDFFNYTLFADDSTLTCSFSDTDGNLMARKIEKELLKVKSWLDVNKIALNLDKTKFMVYNYRKNIEIPDIPFCNQLIERTNKTKFLGVIIDENLRFDSHINHINTKLARCNGILYKLNKFLPYHILKSLYFTLFHPYILYAIEIWHGASQTQIQSVQILQKKAIRAINLLPYNCHTESYFKAAHILRVDDVYKLQISRRVHIELKQDLSNNLFSNIHGYPTRGGSNFSLPGFNLEKTRSSFVFEKFSIWNDLPGNIRLIDDDRKFKYELKKKLVSNYQGGTGG